MSESSEDVLGATFRKLLRELRDTLAPFVLGRVKKRFGQDWWTKGVEPLLHPADRRAALRFERSKEEWFAARDAPFYLKYIGDRWVWKELFKNDFDRAAEAYALELRDNRNIHQHDEILKPLTKGKVTRAVDTSALLFDALGLAPAAQRVRALLQEEESKVPVLSPAPSKLPSTRRVLSATVTTAAVAEAVRFFDSRYGEMEEALWHLSKVARRDLLRQRSSDAVQALVWTIKSWWGIQGVTEQIKTVAARALAAETWTEKLFEATPEFTPAAEAFACERVSGLVSRLQTLGGTTRQEYSLASKVLHWLVPWRVPVYDSLVRKSLDIPSSWEARRAYSELVRKEYDVVRRLNAAGSTWIGKVEPRSPFRAIDKYLWWLAGGPNQKAVIVRDPWKVVRALGTTLD